MPEAVTLVAVSKTRPVEDIQEAYSVGIRDFGENKVQELASKFEVLPKDIRWHLIGHLQQNKVKYLVGKVYLIHSVDSKSLLREIEKRYSAAGETANVLIQVNIAKETTKSGVYLEDLEELLQFCEELKSVVVKGIMGILPVGDESQCRNYFKLLKQLYENLSERTFTNITMEFLSMGMSQDYLYAVAEGSNLVRIGEGIFGKRNYNL